jgi:hypothetical protein
LDEAEQREYRNGQQHEHDNGFLTTPMASLRDLCGAVRGVTAVEVEIVQFAKCRQ